MVEWVRGRLEKGVESTRVLEQLFDEEVGSSEEDYYGTDNMSAILILFKH